MNRSGELTFEVSYDCFTQTTKATFYIPDRVIMIQRDEFSTKMEAFKYLNEHLSSLVAAQEARLICYPLEPK